VDCNLINKISIIRSCFASECFYVASQLLHIGVHKSRLIKNKDLKECYMALIIITIIIGMLALACFIYSIFAFHERGPILDNKYLLATDEERRQISRQNPEVTKKDYRNTAIVFLGISIIVFLFCIGCIFTIFNLNNLIFNILVAVCAVILIIYCIVMRIRSGEYR